MKAIYILLALAFLLVLAGNVAAAPYLMCDSYTTGVIPDTFKTVLNGAPEVTTPAWSGVAGGTTFTNAARVDVGAAAVIGPNVISIRACKNADPIWAVPEVCSNAVPLSFTRPAAAGSPPSAPSGGRLMQ